MRISRRIAALMGAIVATLALSGIVAASHPENYSLFGDATIVTPGSGSDRAAQIRSDATPGFGGIRFGIPTETLFLSLETLATDYRFEAGDSCGGGSPRFQINVVNVTGTDGGNIFVYIGPPPNYTGCPSGVWANTGDLLEGVNLIDTSQLDNGNFYDPYATAVGKYGGYTVTGVQLVVDASWAFPDGDQTAHVDNTNVDGVIYTYERSHLGTKDDCKDGGWQNLARADGTTFNNQGDCVQYANTGN